MVYLIFSSTCFIIYCNCYIFPFPFNRGIWFIQRRILNTVKNLRWSFLTIFHKKLHHRCLTGLQILLSLIFRSSHSQMFFKVSVLKIFAIFTGKHLCWILFLIKLQDWRHLGWLLLKICQTRILRYWEKIDIKTNICMYCVELIKNTHFFPLFSFDPPENVTKTKVF